MSVAILKVNWDSNRDHISNFVPFVAECLRNAPAPQVSLPELQTAILETFGLRIPQGALRTIISRAARLGYVQQAQRLFVRNDSELAKLDFEPVRDNALKQHELLLSKLIGFCRERYRITWSAEEAEAALLDFLQKSSTAILASAVDGTPLPTSTRSVAHSDFLVNAFVVELHERDSEGFRFLETIVKGSMLANVLLFPNLGEVERRFSQVEVYFDTAFMLRALGFAGSNRQTPCRELIDLLYEERATLRIFEHTSDEIHGVLDAAAHALARIDILRHAYGDVVEYFANSGYRPSDVELAIARLPQSIQSLRVSVVASPAHTAPLGVDEQRLDAILQEEVRYSREEARQHDIDSVTAIHRLRQGHLPTQLETCRAIFVTTNAPLVRASSRFYREQYGDDRAQAVVPHCILDHTLATIAWLKRPMSAPDLPRRRIIADCYAAMRPPETLWRRYLEEASNLQRRGDITDTDYTLLRFSSNVRRMLMDRTLGGTEAFTEGTVPEILAAARAAARADAEAALLTERGRREAAEQAVSEVESRYEASRQAQVARLRSIGVRTGRGIVWALLVLATLLLTTAVYFTLPVSLGLLHGWVTWLATPLLIALGAFTVVHLVFGTTVINLLRPVELRCAGFVERVLRRNLGLSQRGEEE